MRYADVAGQAAAVEAVRDVCELPLIHAAYFAALGLTPPRGILLYGPPGNGKTLLAKAVATETNAHLELISGPEILSPWVGASEARQYDDLNLKVNEYLHRRLDYQPSRRSSWLG